MTDDQDLSRGYEPVPVGGEQTGVQKRLEGYIFSAINVAANEVPILGSVLSEARLHGANEVMERRLSTLVNEFKEQVKTVKKSSVDWKFVRSEIFFGLIRQAVEASIRTRDQQKIEFAARVLRGAVVERDQGAYSPEEYLHLLSDLTPGELRVALALYDARPETKDELWEVWKTEVSAELQIDESDLSIALSRVAASGLIQPVTSGEDEGGLWLLPTEPDKAGYYRITKAFEKLMEFLFPADRRLEE